MPGPSWQVNLSGESTPQRRVSTISWSNLTGWLHFPFLFKYFAASSTAARPAPAAAQVNLIPSWHHYRQRWLIKVLYMHQPVYLSLPSFYDLSLSLSFCSLGRASGEYLTDHRQNDEFKLLEWDEQQQQLWDSAASRGAAVPAPALPLLPTVKSNAAASRKKSSVWASEDLQWADEQGGSGLGPHGLARSALPSQKFLLLPKFGLERPFPGTTKTG